MKGKFGHGMMIENNFEAEREQAEEIRRNMEEQRRREAETEELRAQLHKAMEELANARENEGFLTGQVDSLTQQVGDKQAEIHKAYEEFAAEKEQSGMLAQQVRQLAHEKEALAEELKNAYYVSDQLEITVQDLYADCARAKETLEARERLFQNEMEGVYAYMEMLQKTNAVIAEGRAVTRTYTMVQQELKTFVVPQGAVDPAVVTEVSDLIDSGIEQVHFSPSTEPHLPQEIVRLEAELNSLRAENIKLQEDLNSHTLHWESTKNDMDLVIESFATTYQTALFGPLMKIIDDEYTCKKTGVIKNWHHNAKNRTHIIS